MKRAFRIARYNPEVGRKRAYDTFDVNVDAQSTVLGALLAIRDQQDPTLSMRYSCRQATCGSCAMRINGRPRLACKTLVKDLSGTITVEPLPSMPIIKDLVVSFEELLKDFQQLKPFLQPAGQAADNKEYLQTPKDREAIAEVSECIMCGCCQGGCPVREKTPGQFVGPALMVQILRWAADSRDDHRDERLRHLQQPGGITSCAQFGLCSRVCPKEISPSRAVRKLRFMRMASKLKRA